MWGVRGFRKFKDDFVNVCRCCFFFGVIFSFVKDVGSGVTCD